MKGSSQFSRRNIERRLPSKPFNDTSSSHGSSGFVERSRNRDNYGKRKREGGEFSGGDYYREMQRGYRVENRQEDRRRDCNKGNRHDERFRSHSRDRRQEEWKCLECQSWNNPRCTSCRKCGCPKDYHSYEIKGRGRESDHGRRRESDPEKSIDEFGRKIGIPSKPSSRQWPPPFERRSASYIFDARSGMFYHSSTQFFFDPKTKLYYGNKQQKYFTFCCGENPPFKEFKQEDQTKEAKLDDTTTNTEDKKLIAISLKTKKLNSNESEVEESSHIDKKSAGQSSVSKTQKLHDVNIDRWSDRGREKFGKNQIVRTKDGKPVCLLCKRKFDDLDKLDRHEECSSMHKLNLKKYSERLKIADFDKAEAYYRDRALERRVLHGPEENTISNMTMEIDISSPNFVIPEPVENLGESNVGNQMLKKLGWKSGTNLGRNPKMDGSDMTLQKEWKYIEEIAKAGVRKTA